MSEEHPVEVAVSLPSSEVTVSAALGVPSGAWAAVAVAPGAGTGFDHPFITGFAAGMRARGVATLRFNFPYRQAGRQRPGPARHAIDCWSAAVDTLADHTKGLPLFVSGRSYGGRMGSMMLAERPSVRAAGAIYLGYPLHAPGRSDALRVAHLPQIEVPQLFLSGTRDPFVDPHDQLVAAAASCRSAEVRWVDGAGHSFEVAGRKRPADQIAAELIPTVTEWMLAHVPTQRPTA